MSSRSIHVFRPDICEEAIAAVGDVLRSGWLGCGPKTTEFEQRFAELIESPHVVAVNSGTAALHAAVMLLQLPSGAEVITTPMSFISTNHVLLHEGLVPVFADIDPLDGNIRPETIEAALTERTRAIMVVHLGGYPCDLDRINAIARRHNLAVIEDCAHAVGSTWKGRPIGSGDNLCCWSFQAVKQLPVGSGGAISTRSAAHFERLKPLRWLGIDRDTYARSTASAAGKTRLWDYDIPFLGHQFQMNDIAAAIGLAQLRHLAAHNKRRREIAEFYLRELAGVPGVTLPRYQAGRESGYHFVPIFFEDRDGLVDHLKRHDIHPGVHYKRNDAYPMYAPYAKADLPGAEWYWTHEVTLPIHTLLTDDDLETVVKTIKQGW